MSHPVITILPDAPVVKAQKLMVQEKIKQLPVVKNGKLVGIVSRNDILKTYPSSGTTLAVWEIASIIEKIKVKDVMISNVKTVTEDTPIEEAARVMVDCQINSLPVMRDSELVGIITQADLFNMMLEMLGARHTGVRFTTVMRNQPGEIAKITQAIYKKGGDITALSVFEGDSPSTFLFTAKVDGIEQDALQDVIKPLVIAILSISSK
jgi:acetoin utilization protein AcuB